MCGGDYLVLRKNTVERAFGVFERFAKHPQSLGSPSSKLHLHGSPKEAPLSPQESNRCLEVVDDDNRKANRLSLSSPSPTPNKLIHLIPILTLLCFFILYLSSHSPSQSDLAQFKRSSSTFDSAVEMNDIQKYVKVERSDVLAIRSLRNLREIGKRSQKSRPHRKFADF